jgi:hypothetical protein
MITCLGVRPFCSRPRVARDNVCVKPLFRTAKYRPEPPKQGFATLKSAPAWAAPFVQGSPCAQSDNHQTCPWWPSFRKPIATL